MANPLQTGKYIQTQSLALGPTNIAPPQNPQLTASTALLSGNYVSCIPAADNRDGRAHSNVGWQTISIHAMEVRRFALSSSPGLGPLSKNEIVNFATSSVQAGDTLIATEDLIATTLNASRYSALQAKVTFTDYTANQRVVVFDIGGGASFSFCGTHADVEVMLPPGFTLVPANAGPAALALLPLIGPGSVLDTIIEGSYTSSMYAPIGHRLRYTVTTQVTAAIDVLVKIPAGAVRVQTYTGTVGGAFIASFVDNTQRAGVLQATIDNFAANGGWLIPGRSSFIRLNATAATQYLTCVFELEI
ncbi:MAG: hypothetical protein IIB19_02800 [Chloroflexi bacterium]|nr:hypothetical protein [Chloroflexota bacterium]